MTSRKPTSLSARVILSGLAAWAIALVVTSATWIGIIAFRGTHAADEPLIELAIAYPVVMSIPLAFVIVAVTLPMVAAARSFVGDRRVWLALVGAAAAPVGIVAMVGAGRLMFASLRPTLWADLAFLPRNLQGVVPVLLALVIAGITVGVGITRRESRPVA
jgi:hypothetical protein